ncbi:extradiol ring-cleavage dioxygenase [Nocardia vaccinii]|uniref:DODA-type extradiol aromatic ring-opening family dioxygenase n=1 Tax=Nocardia vaccinii TaxID=1822 RepID=UPI001470FFDF|nr:extradiol ring-cleavage dioxygenase [Nocardia vaccinii]
MLAIEGRLWADRGRDDLRRSDLHLADGRVLTYDELAIERGDRYAEDAQIARFDEQAQWARQRLDEIARHIEDSQVDTLIVIGDDQAELFSIAHNPAFAVYTGDEIVMHPKNELHPDLPEWHKVANRGYSMDTTSRHRSDPALAEALVEGLITCGVDVAVATQVKDPIDHGFGHAYGFVAERLIQGKDIAICPILLNTYFPPNVPTPPRCFEIGAYIRKTVEQLPGDRRVGIVASGGLSHFVTDEDLDQQVLTALAAGDGDALSAVPVQALRSGNSETLNWIMAGGALTHLDVVLNDYCPVYRTPAGTGIGLAFMVWR